MFIAFSFFEICKNTFLTYVLFSFDVQYQSHASSFIFQGASPFKKKKKLQFWRLGVLDEDVNMVR